MGQCVTPPGMRQASVGPLQAPTSSASDTPSASAIRFAMVSVGE